MKQGGKYEGLPSRSNLTCFEAVSASVRNRVSICLDRSAANLSSLLDKQPMLAQVCRTELFHTVTFTMCHLYNVAH